VGRSVQSRLPAIPVDTHARARDYLTEDEVQCLLVGTRAARYRWRNAAMLMLTFYHGLRASALCHLRRVDVDLTQGRSWIARLKGSLSTEQPLQAAELRALKRYLAQRGDSRVPWLFLTERGDQFGRVQLSCG
jgi:type 1 fimbriae regulatory protein FimB